VFMLLAVLVQALRPDSCEKADPFHGIPLVRGARGQE